MLPVGCNIMCRGCGHREITAQESLCLKFGFLSAKLSIWSEKLEPVRSVDDDQRWHYRSKTTISTLFSGEEWQFGMWSRNELIPIHHCPVHTAGVNRALAAIRGAVPKSLNFPLAYVVVSGAQIVLVVKSKQAGDLLWMTDELLKALKDEGFEGLWLHLNPSAGGRLFEKSGWHLLWGVPRSVNSNGLMYGPAAFQQLIPVLYNQSLDEVCAFFDMSAGIAVVDLYCGTGNSISRWLSCGASVMGVELGGEAVECARINTPKAVVLRGACRQRVPQFSCWATEQEQVGRRVFMYVNPPRTGLEVEVLDWIGSSRLPERIAYLSCSPGTLSKNLAVLVAHGYEVVRLIPFDFFPQTIHVECLALLVRVG